MKPLKPTTEDVQQVSSYVGIAGGLAGLATAFAAYHFFVWRSGYRAGRRAIEKEQQAADLKSINSKLRGRPEGAARKRRK